VLIDIYRILGAYLSINFRLLPEVGSLVNQTAINAAPMASAMNNPKRTGGKI